MVRTCVASPEASSSFGSMVAEAQERRFYEAKRRAFVADGMAYNWSIHAGYFGDSEPIVDGLHMLAYVCASARAVSADEPSARAQYLVWMRAGKVAQVKCGVNGTNGKPVWANRRKARRSRRRIGTTRVG